MQRLEDAKDPSCSWAPHIRLHKGFYRVFYRGWTDYIFYNEFTSDQTPKWVKRKLAGPPHDFVQQLNKERHL